MTTGKHGRGSMTLPVAERPPWQQQVETLRARRDAAARQLAALEESTQRMERAVAQITQARALLDRSVTALADVTLPSSAPPDDPERLRAYAAQTRALAERLPDVLEDAAMRAEALATALLTVPAVEV